MEHHHLQWPRLVELIRRCEGSHETLLQLFHRLFQHCPQSRAQCADFLALLETGEIQADALDLFTLGMAHSRRKARAVWQEIEGLDLAWKKRRLERETPRWAMVGLLAEESTRLAATDWKAALETAELAVLVAERLEILRPDAPIPDHVDEIPLDETAYLEALGLAYAARGNAYRVDERYVQAQEQFALLDGLAISMPVLGYLPRSLSLRASLYCELHHFEEALQNLDLAQELVREGSPAEEGFLARLHVKHAITRQYQGDLSGASEDICEALELHPPGKYQDRLALTILLAHVDVLSRIPKIDQAQQHLPDLEHLCSLAGSRADSIRVGWLKARLAFATGDPQLALEYFTQSADAWLELGHGYKWSLVRLEQALVYLERGDSQQVRQMASQAVPTLVSLGVSVDVMAAFKLLTQAQEIDVQLVRELLQRLECLPPQTRRDRPQ
jgi:tetratricopeptide (TPR) repeat protein